MLFANMLILQGDLLETSQMRDFSDFTISLPLLPPIITQNWLEVGLSCNDALCSKCVLLSPLVYGRLDLTHFVSMYAAGH